MASPEDGRDGNGRNKDGSSPPPAVRNDDLTDQEIFKLLDNLLDASDPLDCPLPACLYGKFHQIQFLDFHPADIYEKYAKDEVNGYIYFYSRMEFLGNGIIRKRKVRAMNGGMWKTRRNEVVKEKNVDGVAVDVGTKITLVFYENVEKSPPMVTGWTMHEFTKIIGQVAQNKFSVFAVYRLYNANKEGRNCDKKKPEEFAAEAAGRSAPNMDKMPAPASMVQPPPGLAGQVNPYPYAPASMAWPGLAGQVNPYPYAPASMSWPPTDLAGQLNVPSASRPYAPASMAWPGLAGQVNPYPYAPASMARPLTDLAGQLNMASPSHPYAPASVPRPPPGLPGQGNVASTSQPWTPPTFTGQASMTVAARPPGQSASIRGAAYVSFATETYGQRIVRSACGTQPQERSSSFSSPTAAAAAVGGLAVPGGDAMQQVFLELSGVPIDGTVAAPIRTEDDKGAYGADAAGDDDELVKFFLQDWGLTREQISRLYASLSPASVAAAARRWRMAMLQQKKRHR